MTSWYFHLGIKSQIYKCKNYFFEIGTKWMSVKACMSMPFMKFSAIEAQRWIGTS